MNKQKSKILELLYGKTFTYSERLDFDGETRGLIKKLSEAEENFIKKLQDNKELTELFNEYMECDTCAKIAENDVFYSEGFKMGLLIGIEAGEWKIEKIKSR